MRFIKIALLIGVVLLFSSQVKKSENILISGDCLDLVRAHNEFIYENYESISPVAHDHMDLLVNVAVYICQRQYNIIESIVKHAKDGD